MAIKRTLFNAPKVSVERLEWATFNKKPVAAVRVFWNDLVMMPENELFRMDFMQYKHEVEDKHGNMVEKNFALYLAIGNESGNVKLKGKLDEESQAKALLVKTMIAKGVLVVFERDEEGRSLEDVYGTKYHYFDIPARTASQSRQASAGLTAKSKWMEVRENLTYGSIENSIKLGGETAKSAMNIESYVGNSLSSSVVTVTGVSVLYVDDYKTKLDVKDALTVDRNGNVTTVGEILGEDEDGTVETDATDGNGVMSPEFAAKHAYGYNEIRRHEYEYVKGFFKMGYSYMEQIAHSERLRNIWSRIPKSIQYRAGHDKGVVTMLVEGQRINPVTGKPYDLVIGEGGAKRNVRKNEHRLVVHEDGTEEIKVVPHDLGVEDKDVKFLTLSVAGTPSMWATLSHQFIGNKEADFEEDLMPLVKEAEEVIDAATLSAEGALEFLGMMSSDEEGAAMSADVSILTSFIESEPEMYRVPWVEKKIKALQLRMKERMAVGKIPVRDSAFLLFAPDFNVFAEGGQPLLKAGEVYWNGYEGELAGTRYPRTSKHEEVVFNAVTSPELEAAYGHLGKGVIVFNLFDGEWISMGGADFDGDKGLFSYNEHILRMAKKTVAKYPEMIWGEWESSKVEPIAIDENYYKEVRKVWYNTMMPNQVGTVTNAISAMNDLANEIEGAEGMEEVFAYLRRTTDVVGRVNQGHIIDDPKKGTNTPVDQRLYGIELFKVFGDELRAFFGKETVDLWEERGRLPQPHWMKPSEDIDGVKVRHSKSAMGQLFDYVQYDYIPRSKRIYNDSADSIMEILLKTEGVELMNADSLVYPLSILDSQYRQDVADFMNEWGEDADAEIQANGKTPEQRNAAFEELLEFHKAALSAVDAPAAEIGAAAMQVGMNHEIHKGGDAVASWPYIIATDYILALLNHTGASYRLGRISGFTGNENVEKAIIKDGVVMDNDTAEVIGSAKFEDGEYDVVHTKMNSYLKIPVHVTNYVKKEEDIVAEFGVGGFKYVDSDVAKATDILESAIEEGRTVTTQADVQSDGKVFVRLMVDGEVVGTLFRNNILKAAALVGKKLTIRKITPKKGSINVKVNVHNEDIAPVTPKQEEVQVATPASFVADDYMPELSEEERAEIYAMYADDPVMM